MRLHGATSQKTVIFMQVNFIYGDVRKIVNRRGSTPAPTGVTEVNKESSTTVPSSSK
jgi:hypothetical protein